MNKIWLIILIPIFSLLIVSLIYNLDLLSSSTTNITIIPKNTTTSNVQTNSTPITFSNITFTNTSTKQPNKSIFNIKINFGILSDLLYIAIISLAFFALLVLFYSSSGKPTFRFKMTKTYEEPSIESFKKIFQEELIKFESSYKTYSNPILELYKRICEFLEKRGVENAPHLTAREFAEEVTKILGFESRNFYELTKLFEEARYSSHKISEEEVEFARKLIKEIINEIESR
jgi:hypothetical protein